jgi:hypothetical protein
MCTQKTKAAKKEAEEPALNSAIYAKSESMQPPLLAMEAGEAAKEEVWRIVEILEGKGADMFDETTMLLRHLSVNGGEPSEDFMRGARVQEIIKLPDPKKDEENTIKKLEEIEKNQTNPPALDKLSVEERERVIAHRDSHMRVRVFREEVVSEGGKIVKEEGFAIITNDFAIPAPITPYREEFAEAFRRIHKKGDAASMLSALGAWNALKASAEKGIDTNFRVDYYYKVGETKLAQLGELLTSTYKELYVQAQKRLELLASGKGTNSREFRASVEATASLSDKERKIYSRIEDLQVAALSNQLMGKWTIERIEDGIEKGYYNQMEIAAYEGIKRDLEYAVTSMRSLSSAGIEKLRIEGLNGLTAKEKKQLEYVESLVAQLEFIAWKSDMHALEKEMQMSSAEYMSARTQAPQIMGYVKRSKLPLSQLDMRNIEKVEDISYRAKEHAELMKRFVDSFDSSLLTHADKARYKDEIDSLKENYETGILAPLESAAGEMDETLNGVAALVSERALEKEAEDKSNPFGVRAKSYVKIYTLRYSLAVIGGSAAIGGVIGGVSTRTPGGVWLGVKGGAKVGSMIVASAGMGVMGLGAYNYSQGEEGKEQLMDDLRMGSTYLAFGLFGAPAKAFGVPLRLAIGGGVAASNSVLLYDDFKAGDYYNAAADLAYIAMGSVAFIRTATGAFRAIRLKNAVEGSVEIANASGAAKLSMVARAGKSVADRMVKVHKAGYSPGFVLMNAGFGGLANYADIEEALENKKYGLAASIFGRGFTEFTRDFVAFDFALAGVAGSAKTGVRIFRATVPRANAKIVALLHRTGLYEKVADFASAGGLNMYRAQNNARLLELAFNSGGKVSPAYVQQYLGMKSIENARKIAFAINHDWRMARAAFSKARGASKRAWQWVKKAIKSKKFKAAVGVSMASAIYYLQKQDIQHQRRAKELEKIMTPYEFEFIASTFRGDNKGAGVSGVPDSKLYDSIDRVNEISEEVDGGKHAGSIALKLGGDVEKRKWLLSACALALLMNGQEATKGKISKLALSVEKMAATQGISFTYRPVKEREGRPTYSTHFGSVVMMAATLLREGEQGFIDSYSYLSDTQGQKSPKSFTDYALTSIYAASVYGKPYEWAADVSHSLYEGTRNTPHHSKLGWHLLFALGSLESEFPSSDEIDDAFAEANGRVNSWGQE